MLTTHRDRQRGASEKSLDSVSAKGANWVGRNAIARRSASLKSPVDRDPFERPILRPGSSRTNECVRVYHDQCVRISGDGCGTPSPCRNVPVRPDTLIPRPRLSTKPGASPNYRPQDTTGGYLKLQGSRAAIGPSPNVMRARRGPRQRSGDPPVLHVARHPHIRIVLATPQGGELLRRNTQ
jgi:hypothetical protein